ncbi:MAG: magnesium transporter CorA [Clostridium sp.]|nr:magnesium transporter CorA [Clostridium sp.]MBO6149686.1 magnesium transporter CorA [Clostridium sp.]
MRYFVIRETLAELEGTAETILPAKWEGSTGEPFIVIVTREEWSRLKDRFDMGIELEPVSDVHMTRAEVNYDSLTGSFSIPDRADPSIGSSDFAFALDEKGIVFIDDTGAAEQIILNIQKTKRLRDPSLGRFIYDFLDYIVKDDLRLLEKYEDELDEIERKIELDDTGHSMAGTNAVRSDVRKLLIHYDQLIDLAQELEENENGFFAQDNLRYFRLFLSRMERLSGTASSLRDYTMQIGELNKAHLEAKQNNIMTILTVVTTIFMPLTLITGWYGMNFRYMPELDKRWAYPLVFGTCVLIITGSLIFFKKKKWL